MFKYLTNNLREYIFIILTATIFLLLSTSKSFSEENVFIVDNVKVTGIIDVNFSREQYINKAFFNSFEILMSKVLLSKDIDKIKNIKLKKIKYLINSFQILNESYRKNEYKVTFKIFFNDDKVKKFLGQKNISFSQPTNISAVFFPILIVNDEIQDFNDNYFYQKWKSIEIQNETINFILPLEDLEDVFKIEEKKDKIEELSVEDFVNKYDVKNYTFLFMDYKKEKLNIYIKTNFNNNKMSKNISYTIIDIKDELKLNFILIDLKKQIIDIWKEVNIVNLLMPLSLKVKFTHKNLLDLDKLKNTFYKIGIIDNYTLEEFNINNSHYKIYYYGNPKKLKAELLKFGYELNNNQGGWQLYLNE